MSALDDMINGELGATPLVIREHVEKLLEPALTGTSETLHELARVLPPEAVTLLPIIHALAAKLTMLDLKVALMQNASNGPFSRAAHAEAIGYVTERINGINAEIGKEWGTD